MASQNYVRVVKDGKSILDDVTLGHLLGARTWVEAPKGVGKSFQPNVVGGLEQLAPGDAIHAVGGSVALHASHPALDENSRVPETIEEAAEETGLLLHRFEELAETLADRDWDQKPGELGERPGQIDWIDTRGCALKFDQAMRALQRAVGRAQPRRLSGGIRRRVAALSYPARSGHSYFPCALAAGVLAERWEHRRALSSMTFPERTAS